MSASDPLDAWAYRDADAAARPGDGPLAGSTFGVKDIIDVAGMPTGLGLDGRPPRTAQSDAWCVALLRAAGAVPVGKTRTTALAYRDPAPTRHPTHPERTPGGSSAGSAAAVAAGEVPFALGTQTFGSVVRPAAFCGIVGFKPSYGRIAVGGVYPNAPSFDTVGVLARDVATTVRVAEALLPLVVERAAEASSSGRPTGAPPLRLGWAPATLAERFAPATLAALRDYVASIPPALARITTIELSAVAPMLPLVEAINAFEARAVLLSDRGLDADALPPEVVALIARGAAVGYRAYRAALAERERLRAVMLRELAGCEVVLLPLVDEAPARATTGDGLPLAPWTAWGAPCANLPVARSAAGLSLSIGIVAAPGADERVLRALVRLGVSARAGGGS